MSAYEDAAGSIDKLVSQALAYKQKNERLTEQTTETLRLLKITNSLDNADCKITIGLLKQLYNVLDY